MTARKPRKVNRADFGSVRQLPSGRWQARYPDERGRAMTAPRTFETKADASAHLAMVRADRTRSEYVDHREGAVDLRTYAVAWIENGGSRGRLAPRTRGLYMDLLLRHLVPEGGRLTGLTLAQIRPETVRSWYSGLRKSLAVSSRASSGEVRLRQSYALLRAILGQAVSDGKLSRNPCSIVGAGLAEQIERELLTVRDFARVAEAFPIELRPALVLMFGGHLRLGELLALRREDLDLSTGVLTIARQTLTVRSIDPSTGKATTSLETTKPKSGKVRAVQLPEVTVAAMRDYLAPRKGFPKSPLFARADGQPITREQMQRAWRKAADGVGLQTFHLHDVRHAGLTLAAQAGATLAELKARAGHSTTAAAMRYQHAAEERGAIVAAGMNAALTAPLEPSNGTQLAREALTEASEA